MRVAFLLLVRDQLMCDAQLTDGTNSWGTIFNVSASASSRCSFSRSGAIRQGFWINRKGGNLLTAEMDWKCPRQQRLSQAGFLVPFEIERGVLDGCESDEFGRQSGVEAFALLPSVRRAGCSCCCWSICCRCCNRRSIEQHRGGPMQPRLDRPSPPMCLFMLLPADEPPDEMTLVFFCAWNSAGSWSASWVVRWAPSRRASRGKDNDCRSSLQPDASSGDGWSVLVPEQHPGWMPSMQYGSLNLAIQQQQRKVNALNKM